MKKAILNKGEEENKSRESAEWKKKGTQTSVDSP